MSNAPPRGTVGGAARTAEWGAEGGLGRGHSWAPGRTGVTWSEESRGKPGAPRPHTCGSQHGGLGRGSPRQQSNPRPRRLRLPTQPSGPAQMAGSGPVWGPEVRSPRGSREDGVSHEKRHCNRCGPRRPQGGGLNSWSLRRCSEAGGTRCVVPPRPPTPRTLASAASCFTCLLAQWSGEGVKRDSLFAQNCSR